MSKNRRLKLRLVGAPARPQWPAVGGKVTHDSRGNAVWDWAIDTGVLAGKTAAELLCCLERPGMLALEDDVDPAANEWAGDPYNRKSR
jgi:hypothetical protein